MPKYSRKWSSPRILSSAGLPVKHDCRIKPLGKFIPSTHPFSGSYWKSRFAKMEV